MHVAVRDPLNIYHYRDGEPNILAAGMLLESLRIAASMHGRRMEWHVETEGDPLRLHVHFASDETVAPDPLYAALGQRSVDRNRYRNRRLTHAERLALENSLGEDLQAGWHDTLAERLRFARGQPQIPDRRHLAVPRGRRECRHRDEP